MRFGLVLGWFWAGFGPVGSTEKNFWADYELLLRAVFYVFMAKS